jgi:hypothetical protein
VLQGCDDTMNTITFQQAPGPGLLATARSLRDMTASPPGRGCQPRHGAAACSLLSGLFLALATAAGAQEATPSPTQPAMTFAVQRHCDAARQPALCNMLNREPGALLVVGNGRIEADSHQRLQELAATLPRGSLLVMDSLGGALGGGLRLGQTIRSLGLRTMVAPPQSEDPESGGRLRGVCVSACVYAFLGGIQRHAAPGGRLGVHQFRGATTDIDGAQAQKISVLLGRYLDVMGVDRKLLDAALSTSHQAVHWLPEDTARRWNVLRAQEAAMQWRLSATPSGELVLLASGVQNAGTDIAAVALASGTNGPRLVVAWRRPAASAGAGTGGGTQPAVVAQLILGAEQHSTAALQTREISPTLMQASFGLDAPALAALCNHGSATLRVRRRDDAEPLALTLGLDGMHGGLTAILRLSGLQQAPCKGPGSL